MNHFHLLRRKETNISERTGKEFYKTEAKQEIVVKGKLIIQILRGKHGGFKVW